MSTGASPPRARGEVADRTFGERTETAFLLAGMYVALCMVYVVEAWKHVTPWLFGDELELTQLSRAIAATGHAARRGVTHSPDSIYTYAMAPFWLIHNVGTAYASVKYLDVFVMASVLFPTYLLARLVVGRRMAVFAAACAAATPSLAYSSYIVEETFAYPYATWCLFLIAKTLVERSRGGHWYRWLSGAIVASLFAAAVKGELLVIPGVLALTVLFAWWSGDPMRARRSMWSIGDWIGTSLLVLGAIFLLSAVASHHSLQWLSVTRAYKHRTINQGNWAVGSLAIGLGVVPLVAGLASLFAATGERLDRQLRTFRCVTLASLIAFVLYAAMKAAYLSSVFATRVEERNVMYVAPVLFIGTALVLERRRVNLLALGGASIYGLYLVGYALYHSTQSPYEMGVRLYSDALGFAIAQRANLELSWTPHDVRIALVATLVIGVLALVAIVRLSRPSRLTAALVASLAGLLLTWNLTGEISAAVGTDELSRASARTLRHPFSWLDDATGRRPTLYMGASEQDQNPEWLLEFWNRSIARVSSLDGTVDGPGPAGGPNLERNGTLVWGTAPPHLGPQYDYAVENGPCMDLAGTTVTEHLFRAGGRLETWRLVRLTHPNRLRSTCTGISPDGWTGPTDSAYFRFSGPGGWLRMVYSRRDWGYPSGPTSVRFILGKLVINANQAPILGPVTKQVEQMLDSQQTKVEWLRVPAGPFAVHVVVARKVVPHAYNPGSGDRRRLGVELTYQFRRRR